MFRRLDSSFSWSKLFRSKMVPDPNKVLVLPSGHLVLKKLSAE